MSPSEAALVTACVALVTEVLRQLRDARRRRSGRKRTRSDDV